MLNVTTATKNAYLDYGSTKNLTVTISAIGTPIVLTNDDLVSQSITLQERIESEANLTFIGCISSVLRFKCVNTRTNIKNAKIVVTMVANNTETIPLFSGHIVEINNTSHEQSIMEITAFDDLDLLRDVDVKEWYEELDFPVTLRQFRDSLFSYLYTEYGLQQNTVTLPNDAMLIYKSIDSDIINCLDVLKYICQINARFGRIDRYGKFDYLKIQTNVTPTALSKSYYSSVDFENFTTTPISRVILRDKDDSRLRFAGQPLTNIWNINANPLIWNYEDPANLQTVADNLLAEVGSITYTPLTKLEILGLPYMECGDYISIEARNYSINTYILERTLTGIQAIKDSYVADSIKEFPLYSPQMQQQVKIINNKVEKVTNNVEAINNNISTINDDILDITETLEDKQDTLIEGSGITISDSTIGVTNPITYGTTDIGVGAQLATGTIYFVYEA